MTNDISRRDFLAATAAMAAASQVPIGAIADRRKHRRRRNGRSVPGGSITDAGRNRESGINAAGALGNGYPLLVASAVLAARPAGGLRFYNRASAATRCPTCSNAGRPTRSICIRVCSVS